jgi:uncharacterized repeat protein (TIGR01451 family)
VSSIPSRLALLVLCFAAGATHAQRADLSLTHVVSDPAPVIGSQVTFTITVTNSGPRAAQGIVVRDRLPNGYAYASHQVSRGYYAPGSGNWNLGLPKSSSAVLTIVATVNVAGTYNNVSEILASSVPDPDSVPGNGNTAEDDYAACATTPVPDNVAPEITGQAALATPEETALAITPEHLTVSDPDDVWPDDFTLTVQPGSDFTLDGANVVLPARDFTGTLAVPVVVNDGDADSAPFVLTVDVTPTNDAPVVMGQMPLSVPADEPFTLSVADLAIADPDNVFPDDFALIVAPGPNYAVTGPTEITPDPGFSGDLVVTIAVSDGAEESPPYGLHVAVGTDNVPPVITGQAELRTPARIPLAIGLDDLTVVDPDDLWPDDFSLALLPGESYDVTAPGEITPHAGFAGTLAVPVTVSDGTDVSAPFDLAVTVDPPPNIVFMMLDDLDTRSLDDLLAAGLMPNLRTHIVDRGISFEQAYVTTPLCCPSRATFLTGNYPHNVGVLSNRIPIDDDPTLQWAVGAFDDSDTIATRLQGVGYTTALVGKYLNGYGYNPGMAGVSPAYDPHYVPPGWSSWHVLVDFSTYCVYNYTISHDGVTQQYLRPPEQAEDSATYQTNVLADIAESFVAEHVEDDAPFFLWVAPLAPHTEECQDAYGGPPPGARKDFTYYIRPAPEFTDAPVPAFTPTPSYDENLADKPAWMQAAPLDATDLANVSSQYARRLRSILSVDVMIGRIAATLGPELDNTVLVFTSDNGWFYGEHRRSEKVLAYGQAARVPLYVAMPGARAPQSRAGFVLNNDLAPTILDLASPGYGDDAFDGRSIAPLLRDAAPPGWVDRAHFLTEYGRFVQSEDGNGLSTYLALRTPDTLYIESYAGTYQDAGTETLWGLELYDLVADPHEMSSLMHHPEDARHPGYGPWLDLLETCAGASCKPYENGLTSP